MVRFSKLGSHILPAQKEGLVGTPRFASVNAHEEKEQSRKDDLLSLGYTLIYLYQGILPWINLPIEDPEKKLQEIKSLKKSFCCSGFFSKLPIQFHLYFQLVDSLGFSDQPNYFRLKSLFQGLILQSKESMDNNYDWIIHDKGTLKLPQSFCHITSNFFYKFERTGTESANISPVFTRHLQTNTQLFSSTIPFSNITSGIKVHNSPLSNITTLVQAGGSHQMDSTRPQESPTSQLSPKNNQLNDSGFSFTDDMDEEPCILDKMTTLKSFNKSMHTFKEVKFRFSPQLPLMSSSVQFTPRLAISQAK